MAGHPARFSDSILVEALRLLHEHEIMGGRVLDPFAGTGKGVEFLNRWGFTAQGIDLEPAQAWGGGKVKNVYVGDALATGFANKVFDLIFTSPCYGNRFADRDMRPSCAGTYMKGLGREAKVGSACHLQWGQAYRDLHADAWNEARRVLKPHGHLLLNISDHYRDKKPMPVSAWHIEALGYLGFEWIDAKPVHTPRQKKGANAQYRCEAEWLHLFKLVA
jgi:DNA modification methylase